MKFKEALLNGFDVKQMIMGGMIEDAKYVRVFALNGAVVAAQTSICPQGGVYANPASASQLTVVSSSSSDASGGTGIKTVIIEGLDANYAEISETVALNGTTPVTTTASFLRVFSMNAETSGTGLVAAGNITAKIASTTYAQITANFTASYNSNYTVPANKKAYIMHGGATSSAATIMSIQFKATIFNKAPRGLHLIEVYQRPYDYVFPIPMEVEAKTDLDVLATGTATSSKVTATYDMIIVG